MSWHHHSREHSLAAKGIKTRVSAIGRPNKVLYELGFKNPSYLKGQVGKTINAYNRDGKQVATATYYYMPGNMELALLGVDKSLQDKGIGSNLVDLVIKKQERLGSNLYVKAEPDKGKKGALISFYESKGFRKVRQLENGVWLMKRPPSGRMPTSIYNRKVSGYTFKEVPAGKSVKSEDLDKFLESNNLEIRRGRELYKGEREIVVDFPTHSERFFIKSKFQSK